MALRSNDLGVYLRTPHYFRTPWHTFSDAGCIVHIGSSGWRLMTTHVAEELFQE
jgi:hypothetical protein